MNELDYGIFDLPLILPASLEPRRHEFSEAVLGAQLRIVRFAREHGWEAMVAQSFADRVEIYAAKPRFDAALRSVLGLDPATPILATACAALEQRVLLAVSPECYANLYPEGIEEHSYEKLMAHEIGHRLHIRILAGNEEAMGPIWFFEGFAIYAANQFADCCQELAPDEIRAVLIERERSGYRRYGSVFRRLAERFSLPDLIARAGAADFRGWLQANLQL